MRQLASIASRHEPLLILQGDLYQNIYIKIMTRNLVSQQGCYLCLD
jgi:hypothetical protein